MHGFWINSGKIPRPPLHFISKARAVHHNVLNLMFSLWPPLTISSMKNPHPQREIKIAAETREEVNFLIWFQSPVLPRGLSWRKLVVVAWAELRLQNAEGWFCEVCWWSREIVRVCVCGRLKNQSSVRRRMSSDELLIPVVWPAAPPLTGVLFSTEKG